MFGGLTNKKLLELYFKIITEDILDNVEIYEPEDIVLIWNLISQMQVVNAQLEHYDEKKAVGNSRAEKKLATKKEEKKSLWEKITNWLS